VLATREQVRFLAGTTDVTLGYTCNTATEEFDAGLPPEFFKFIDTSNADTVTIELLAKERVRVRAAGHDNEHIFPRTKASLPEWPMTPRRWSEPDEAILPALHEASRCSEREPGPRWATQRLQLHGSMGRLVGTDGKQLLIQEGFHWPFSESLLVPALPIYGANEWRGSSARIGRTANHVVLSVGAWLLALAIDTAGKFPDAMAAIPKAMTATTLTLAERDAVSLLTHLKQCSTDKELPITLDIRGERVAVRYQDASTNKVTEIRLPSTRGTGPPVQVACLRSHWLHGLELGLRQITLHGANKPILFHAHHRQYLVVTLDTSAVVAVSRPATIAEPNRMLEPSALGRSLTKPLLEKPMPLPNSPPNSVGDAVPDLLAEAEAVRELLSEATQRITQLVQLLKAKRKADRAISQAVRSLQAIPLLGKE
jgi:hypothetical protein